MRDQRVRGKDREFRGRSMGLVLLLASVCVAFAQRVPAAPKQAKTTSEQCVPLVIQGRITAVSGNVITLKTPDDYPGTGGIHSQAVGLGPTYRADVSHGHVLLPDGRRPDTRPLAVGEYVLVVLKIGSSSPSAAPSFGRQGTTEQMYSAMIIERLAGAERFIGH